MERRTEHSGRLLAVARTLRYLAEDPFAFETFLRQVAVEFEAAARQRPARPLSLETALHRVLERIAGAAPPVARPVARAALRQSVPRRRARHAS
jgi:hypothetical protein